MQGDFQNGGFLLRDAEGCSLLRDAEGSLFRLGLYISLRALYPLGAIGNPYCLVWLHLYAIAS